MCLQKSQKKGAKGIVLYYRVRKIVWLSKQKKEEEKGFLSSFLLSFEIILVNYDLSHSSDKYWAKSFTSLTADFHQDINRVGVLMEHFFEGSALLKHWYINPSEKSNKYKSSLLN